MIDFENWLTFICDIKRLSAAFRILTAPQASKQHRLPSRWESDRISTRCFSSLPVNAPFSLFDLGDQPPIRDHGRWGCFRLLSPGFLRVCPGLALLVTGTPWRQER
ncbi:MULTISPECIES: hypothetical protein [Streptomyces]|uniref:hypothetical protein n=1 Tax=Streptomyces TaxID=1883 RepID=UPI0005187C7C|nr:MULTISPECIES: hypothetical protein [Streptomyces]KOT60570.1 hypothetical protein ADK43_14065 [Streptomyces rimosus subsp. rimosus]